MTLPQPTLRGDYGSGFALNGLDDHPLLRVDFANLSTWNASTAAMNGTFSHPDFNFSTFRTTKDGDTYTNDAKRPFPGVDYLSPVRLAKAGISSPTLTLTPTVAPSSMAGGTSVCSRTFGNGELSRTAFIQWIPTASSPYQPSTNSALGTVTERLPVVSCSRMV